MIHLKNLPLPCPVNRLWRAMPIRLKSGLVITKNVRSKEARLRQEALVAAIWQQLGGRPVPMTRGVMITYTITPRDRRTPDVDAFEKHLLDCLEHASVYADDKQVVNVSKERLQPQRPGHLDVQIWELE